MIEWLVDVHRLMRSIRAKTSDGLDCLEQGDEGTAEKFKRYVKEDLDRLRDVWVAGGAKESVLRDLIRHAGFFQNVDLHDMLTRDILAIEEAAENLALAAPQPPQTGELASILHPKILEHAYAHLENGNFRNAVFDGVVAVFDMIREKSGLDLDGPALINAVFAPSNPMFVFSEVETVSGQDEQKGYHKIFLGVYEGVRNPKAHRLTHDLTQTLAAQHLVQLSLLARKVNDAAKNPAYVPRG